ncbi:MAG: methylmalonyl-CoA epimerase [Dehalococcoidia bacterium]|nr:methylmalonyl-CoA epimerase [Dehalococcoidia bacterium]
MIKKIDHVGMAVNNLDSALAFYRDVLGIEASSFEDYAPDQIRTAFLKVGDASFEVMAPTSPESPVAKFLEKRGEGMHHISLEVDDIRAELKKLEAKGVALIDKEPRQGAHFIVAFVHPRSTGGVLLELTQKPK